MAIAISSAMSAEMPVLLSLDEAMEGHKVRFIVILSFDIPQWKRNKIF